MIKQEYQLVAIPMSLKEYRAGVLVQLKNTKQFGTIRKESLRGKYARRDLRRTFNEVSLYLTNPQASVMNQRVIVTLRDNSQHAKWAEDLRPEDIVAMETIVMFQKDILDAWVHIPNIVPDHKFHQLTPKIVRDILNKGGKVYMEMEYENEWSEKLVEEAKEPIHFHTKVKLLDGYPIIHLEP